MLLCYFDTLYIIHVILPAFLCCNAILFLHFLHQNQSSYSCSLGLVHIMCFGTVVDSLAQCSLNARQDKKPCSLWDQFTPPCYGGVHWKEVLHSGTFYCLQCFFSSQRDMRNPVPYTMVLVLDIVMRWDLCVCTVSSQCIPAARS